MVQTAKDIMSSPVICVSPEESLTKVGRILVDASISGVPVVAGGKLQGIVSRSDFARVPVLLDSLRGYVSDFLSAESAAAMPSDPGTVKVGDIMATHVETCAPDTPVSEIARTMIARHIHRVVVMEDNQPAGIVESLDVVGSLTDC